MRFPDGKCYSKPEEWWTYELCIKRSVRQFHMDGAHMTSEYHLGDYETSDLVVQVCVPE